MSTQNLSIQKIKSTFAAITIPSLIVIAFALYYFLLGNPENFKGGTTEGHPDNYLGIVYKGGIIVPILMSFFLMVITFSLERYFTIRKATGTGALEDFLRSVKVDLAKVRIDDGIKKCEIQKGSVGNVALAGLLTYKEVLTDNTLSKDQKVLAVQKDVEEATSLELPMLEKNLAIIATLASIATLTGLLGTVLGMIKAFSALATTGTPDAMALANGISEALINTALGISTSAFAIVSYNYFTSRIDSITYNIDEISFSITQGFSASYRARVDRIFSEEQTTLKHDKVVV
jgi:biopolymer transport protein ExbB